MPMKMKYLGSSGTKVSELCLGTMTFGQTGSMPGQCGESASHELLTAFADAGGNFIDSANVYQGGVSEQYVGSWLAGKARDDFVVATKLRFGAGAEGGANNQGLGRKHVKAAVARSLANLQTDCIDLLQIHAWDVGTPIKETLATFDELIRSGKVNYIGASNCKGWQLQKALSTSEFMHLAPFVTLQPKYNLLCRQTEWELVECCLDGGVGILPWSPLNGGWLAGKMTRGAAVPTGSRIEWSEKDKPGLQSAPDFSSNDTDWTWGVVEEVAKVAAEAGKSSAQVSLRWLMQKPGVVAPVIGAKTVAQLKDNVGACDFELSAEQMARLDAVSVPEHQAYPWEMCTRVQGGRLR